MKNAGTQVSYKNINEPLDFFFKLFLTNELINEMRKTNNYAIKKLEGKVLLLYLP